MRNFAIIFGLALMMCLIVFGFKQCEVRRLERTITAYSAALDSCLHAEPQRDTVWQFKTLRDTIRLNYSYHTIDTIKAPDGLITAFGDDFGIEAREYTGNYTSELINIRWRAVILGELKSMEILPTSTYRYPEITLTRTVALPAKECDPVKLSRERSHIYFTGGIGYYRENDMLFNIGAQVIWRRGWGFGGGVTLDNSGKFYWGGNLIVRVI